VREEIAGTRGPKSSDQHNAMPASRPNPLVRPERRVDIDHSIQSTSEGHSIFEGLRSTLARVREHRVRRVTGAGVTLAIVIGANA